VVKSGIAVVGGFSLIGLGGYLLYQLLKKPPLEGQQYTLVIEATVGGTTNPKPGTYYSGMPTTVTVTAIPNSGYNFDGWFVSGVKVSTELTYTVDVSSNVLLIASFLKEGQPPLIPAYIRPVQNAISEEWWKVWVETIPVGLLNHYVLRFAQSRVIEGYIKFKIADNAGNGVAGQSIALYTDSNPDELGYGYVYLNGAEHTESNPLILISDASGVVSVKVTYKWIEPEGSTFSTTLGYGAKAHWVCPVGYGWLYPIVDGNQVVYPCGWDGYERIKHPVYRNINYVHAYWVDNPNLPVYGDATADCMIKLEDKLT